jgi:hypothetical protein
MDENERAVISQAQAAMAAFRAAFGTNLSVGMLAEILAALELGLTLTDETTTPGYDAVSQDGARYQVKYRADSTPQIDMNNFDFDYLLLINLDEGYRLREMWRITVEQAQAITTERIGDGYHRYQTNQTKIKAIGERIV